VDTRVGRDIGSVCRKCGDVWHVVVAASGGRIAQVECKQCGARHRYRPADGEAEGKAGAGPRKAGARTASPRTGKAAGKKPVVAADLSRPSRRFQMSETYAVGDRVVHASFGEGVVQAVTGVRKVEILFEAGPKTLVHGRGQH
jgi:hypothetical protein